MFFHDNLIGEFSVNLLFPITVNLFFLLITLTPIFLSILISVFITFLSTLEKEILFQNDLETLIGKRPFESKQITQEEDKDEINKITDDSSSDKEEK